MAKDISMLLPAARKANDYNKILELTAIDTSKYHYLRMVSYINLEMWEQMIEEFRKITSSIKIGGRETYYQLLYIIRSFVDQLNDAGRQDLLDGETASIIDILKEIKKQILKSREHTDLEMLIKILNSLGKTSLSISIVKEYNITANDLVHSNLSDIRYLLGILRELPDSEEKLRIANLLLETFHSNRKSKGKSDTPAPDEMDETWAFTYGQILYYAQHEEDAKKYLICIFDSPMADDDIKSEIIGYKIEEIFNLPEFAKLRENL